eukprot:comp22648_c0_seq1/m.34905 comp22648_c0_seq1/g.34905  ORF comp22648_c0_seq1/g.34905 comp22648_c0_seq1/m.34905 type:complete len:153 (-) comp22648_c0_seq1:42-500(-)
MEHKQDHVWLTDQPISIDHVHSLVSSPSAGAISSFVGTTRDNFEGKRVLRLEYEAYPGMAEKQMLAICAEMRARWQLIYIGMVHRVGVVPIQGASIVICVSSAHRTDSLQAVQYAIDAVKERVPVWKKEWYEGEEYLWKENCEACARHGTLH